MIVSIILFALFLLQIAAFWCAWRAVTSSRTPQGAVGWVVFLLAAPYIAVLAYLFLGHHRYRGYEVTRLSSERVVAAIKGQSPTPAAEIMPVVDPAPFEKIAELPAVRGNHLAPLIDGPRAFEAMFKAIDAAQAYVLVQFFIVHDDTLGQAFKDHLIAAARRGVSVRFMADAIGSHALSEAYLDALSEAGVHIADPRSSSRPHQRFQINYRNHRKTVIVDGHVGFTGGLNVGDEYMGRDPNFGHWRDTHVEIRGPVVAQLQLIFAEDWHWAEGDLLLEDLNWAPGEQPANQTALIVATGPADTTETGAMFFFSAIAAAKERIWIASPYCVPDTDIIRALQHAALAGRDVRLLVPEMIDHTISWLAAFSFFDELRDAGVQIWRYNDGFMHQKVVLVDDDFAAIGTTNLDNRSFRLNFEAMLAGFDGSFAQEVAEFLKEDFTRATLLETPLTDQPAKVRYGAPVARLFAPLL